MKVRTLIKHLLEYDTESDVIFTHDKTELNVLAVGVDDMYSEYLGDSCYITLINTDKIQETEEGNVTNTMQ